MKTWMWVLGGAALLWWVTKASAAVLGTTQQAELQALYTAALMAKGQQAAVTVWQGANNMVCVGWTLASGAPGGSCYADYASARAAVATV